MMVFSHGHHPEDAMKFATRFLKKFAVSIIAVLSCFDRVIFKGYLPFWGEAYLNSWVDYSLRIKRKDFLPLLEQHSQTLVGHAKSLAQRAGRPYGYRP